MCRRGWIISGHARVSHACRSLILKSPVWCRGSYRPLWRSAPGFSRRPPHRRAGHHARDRIAAGRDRGISVGLGHPEFLLARAHPPAGRRRRAVAGADDGVGAALRPQIPRADDDGELRRPHDHRHRHRQLPVHDLSGVALDRGAVPHRAGAAGGVHVARRSVPRPPAGCGSGAAGLRRRAYGGGDASADAAVRGVLRRQPGVVLRALRRRRDLRTAHPRPYGIRRRRRRTSATGRR